MNAEKYSRGAEWRQWDLHFHTPSSYDYEDKKNVTDEDLINGLSMVHEEKQGAKSAPCSEKARENKKVQVSKYQI
jgi:hypothetical protein